MSDIHQVWEGHDGWKTLCLRYYVHQDFHKQPDIGTAFGFIASASVLGAQVGSVTVNSLTNRKIDLNATLGKIIGEIEGWQGYQNDDPAAWSGGKLTIARFLLVLDIDIALPPPFGKVVMKGFHKPCTVLLHWDINHNQYVYMPT